MGLFLPTGRYRPHGCGSDVSDVTASANPLRAYAAVTAAYWAFMLSDGALRMLVLLHFNALGFSPVQLAWLFLLYEVAGIVTNLAAGWLAARFGLAATLYGGLSLQIGALVALAQLDPAWSVAASVAFVMAVQGVSGVAKDLAKMSSKSAVKLLAPTEDGGLFRWVAALTGSKNAVKGFGFFLGAALLGLAGFDAAVWGMAAVLAVILLAVVLFLPAGLPGRMKSDESWSGWRSKDIRVNRLSLARMFLFGARDVWFVVALPVFLSEVLDWEFWQVGSFMAAWIIGYGLVQSLAPYFTGRRTGRAAEGSVRDRSVPDGRTAFAWASVLALVPAVMAWLLHAGHDAQAVVIAGLSVFGVLFAINSSLHSFLIVSYAGRDGVSLDVGFYYMANAMGRLLGTLLSGWVYQVAGLGACLVISALLVALAAAVSIALPRHVSA